jgi:hypothetical protein
MHRDVRLYAAQLLTALSLERRTCHWQSMWRAPNTTASRASRVRVCLGAGRRMDGSIISDPPALPHAFPVRGPGPHPQSQMWVATGVGRHAMWQAIDIDGQHCHRVQRIPAPPSGASAADMSALLLYRTGRAGERACLGGTAGLLRNLLAAHSTA